MTVSVVISTTGREELKRALDSVRAQTIAPESVVVVLDDPDGRERVMGILGDEKLVVTARLGGAAARQAGVDSCAGEYVAFLDDDDWWEPAKLETQRDALRRVGGDWSFTGATLVSTRSARRVPADLPPASSSDLPDYVLARPALRYGSSFVQSSTLMVTRNALNDYPWESGLPKHQDWDLVIRLAQAGLQHVFVNEHLTWVQQGSSASISKRTAWRSSADWISQHIDLARGRGYADFVCSIVARQAFAERDFAGVAWSLACLKQAGSFPHVAAVLVGLAGIARR